VHGVRVFCVVALSVKAVGVFEKQFTGLVIYRASR
jgi:hypothetical protein